MPFESLLLIVLFLLICSTGTPFQILSPHELITYIDLTTESTDPYLISTASFGIPYLSHRCGTYRVVISNPHHACTSLKMSYNTTRYEGRFWKDRETRWEDADEYTPDDEMNGMYASNKEEPFILLVHRGHCTFVEKAQNAAKAGFYNMIIWNNTPENSLRLLTDDGKGSGIRSKILMVTQEIGLKMIEWMEKNPGEVVRVQFGFCPEHRFY